MRVASYIVVVVMEALLIVWFARDSVPSAVGKYIAFCPDHLSACEDKVSEADTALRLTYMPGEQYCPPERPDRAGEERNVRTWLSSRPGIRTRSTATSISDALLANHRCEVRVTGASQRRAPGGG